MRIQSTRRILAALLVVGSVPLAACSANDEGLHVGDIDAAVYVPADSAFDVLKTGTVVTLDGGCLGIEGEGFATATVLALAKGSSISESGQITAVGDATTGDKKLVFAVGDEITFTGSEREEGANTPAPETQMPSSCPDDAAVWFLLPA